MEKCGHLVVPFWRVLKSKNSAGQVWPALRTYFKFLVIPFICRQVHSTVSVPICSVFSQHKYPLVGVVDYKNKNNFQSLLLGYVAVSVLLFERVTFNFHSELVLSIYKSWD